MKQTKNLLITTLGYTKHHLHIEYYSCLDKEGEVKFCTGISGAEAGTKYILSRHQIDEIIVLGPESAAGSNPSTAPISIETFSLPEASDLSCFSEFDFYCYRLQQYLEHLDIEAHDILNCLSQEEQTRLRSIMASKLSKGRDGQFYLAATDQPSYERFLDTLGNLNSREEKRWMKHMMYQEMDSFFKLRALRCNSGLTVRFVPVEKMKNGSFSVKSMASIVDSFVNRYKKNVNLYVDLQGMDKADSYTMNSMLSFSYNAEQALRVKCMIHTRNLPDSFVHSIDNEIHRYDFELLLSGLRAFTTYGKCELLEEYCESHQITDKTVLDMLMAMRYVDTGVSLCNLEDLKYGIQALKKILKKDIHISSQVPETAVFNILKRGIIKDYGTLLKGEEVSIPELIDWALRKHFYQQALTMIESLVPGDLVSRGILYYGQTKKDIKNLMERWNILYWNEIPKCRYIFKNPNHYFIKSYGRTAINNAQAPQNVVRDLAKAMVGQLQNEKSELCPVYSVLKDKELLYELLVCYYSIGNLRNRVSHANSAENALNGQEELMPNQNFEILKADIAKFLKIYKTACQAAENSKVTPLQITETDFRFYTRHHRLQPLTDLDPDQLLENHYQCEYNGQTLSIAIRMLRPCSEDSLS